jgi:glycosyltransferase involved in cell wall biosynthesis
MDAIFLDVTSKRYYDNHALEKEPMGGTEASVVRVAEGLAGFGLKVAVVQGQIPYFEPMTSKFAFYFHTDDLPKLRCKHFIQLRGIKNSHLFPNAKKYVWLHDAPDERIKAWDDVLWKAKTTIVCVSRWMKKEVQKYTTTHRVEYIYNPVPDEIYKPSDIELKYNSNNLIWAASPHKGLGKAIEVFNKAKSKLPKLQLIIANPGYLQLDTVALQNHPGVSMYGAVPCRSLWAALQNSLCVFYPSDYAETFCCILAEANALGVPMLGYNHGALKEVVSSDDQLVELNNEDALIDRLADWTAGNRPKIEGRREFELSRVVLKWIQLLASKS